MFHLNCFSIGANKFSYDALVRAISLVWCMWYYVTDNTVVDLSLMQNEEWEVTNQFIIIGFKYYCDFEIYWVDLLLELCYYFSVDGNFLFYGLLTSSTRCHTWPRFLLGMYRSCINNYSFHEAFSHYFFFFFFLFFFFLLCFREVRSSFS